MANAPTDALLSEQQANAGKADQHRSEAGRQDVALTGAAEQRAVPLHQVDDDQDREIEHATAERVADGDIRCTGRRHRADPGSQLG